MRHCLAASLILVVGLLAGPVGAKETTVSRVQAAAEPYVFEQAPQEHVQDVADSPHAYGVEMGGTLDGFNTVFYRQDSGYLQESKFEPNEYLVLENVGSVDVVNPRIVINGRRNWHSAAEILAGILKPGMTDAEKAMAIYMFTASFDVQSHNNARTVGSDYPWAKDSHPSATLGDFQERANPVKAANLYYCGGCSYAAANFAILCRHAGLPSRIGWLGDYVEGDYRRGGAHCMPEVWYDGAWHLFDADQRIFYLEADNRTVASWETLGKNPGLAARALLGGFPAPSHWVGLYAELFAQQPFATQMPVDQWLSTMDMTLRPGEKFIWRWDHIGKWRYSNKHENKPDWVPFHLGNGKIIYRPKLTGKLLAGGILGMQNVKSVGDDPSGGQVQPILAGPPGYVIYKVSSPYPIVGGGVGAKFQRKTAQDHCRILISVRDEDYREIWSAADNAGEMQPCVAIDEVLSAKWSSAIYSYYVKLELQAATAPEDVLLEEVYLEADVQMATTANPALSVGVNEVVYCDQSTPGRQVRITHGWKESLDTQPPLAPPEPVAPADGAAINLATLKTLTWQASEDPDGQPIAEYHVQVSPREDMLHPVSPNLDRLTFSGKPEWAVPGGWLNKGNTYYWRVRARDQWGAWSDWSQVWKFHINPAQAALLAHYELNESSGIAASDSSGNNNHGTLQNFDFDSDDGWRGGHMGNAILQDGKTANDPGPEGQNIRLPADMSTASTGTVAMWIKHPDVSQVGFTLNNGDWWDVYAGGTVNSHLGSLVRHVNESNWQGLYDQVRIYDTALSPEEIVLLAQEGPPPPKGKLLLIK